MDSKHEQDAKPTWSNGSGVQGPRLSRKLWLIVCTVLVIILITSREHLGPSREQHQPIPDIIWQVFLEPTAPPERMQTPLKSWLELNPDHEYTLLRGEGAASIRARLYKDYPQIHAALSDLTPLAFRIDILRYALLAMYGGVYSDIDVTALKPISTWIPPQFAEKTRVVLGVEYDELNAVSRWPGLMYSFQLCQWTMMTAPNHELLWSVANMSSYAVLDLADELGLKEGYNTTDLGKNFQKIVMETTGPVVWTAAVLRYLRKYYDPALTYRNLSGISEPALFHDVLILPIDAFGTGQPHSGASREGSSDALVRHHFWGSWKPSDEWGS